MGGTCCITRDKDQVGKSILWLPSFQVRFFLNSIDSAEEKLKRPPNCIEIFVEVNKLYPYLPIGDVYGAVAILFSLLREDMVYANQDLSQFTTNREKNVDYLNYS